jgi:SAM-dependent methyltransferase
MRARHHQKSLPGRSVTDARMETIMMTSAAAIDIAPPVLDPTALKRRQQAAWSSGDYAVVGTTLQIVGEETCEALDLRSSQNVLDVTAGNGNVSLAAARRWCDVVATDYVPALLDRARERGEDERLRIKFREANAEALPFPDACFDCPLWFKGPTSEAAPSREKQDGC